MELQDDSYFSVTSSDVSHCKFLKLRRNETRRHPDRGVKCAVAKKMVFELPGFTDLEATISQAISLILVLGRKQVLQILQLVIQLRPVRHIR